MSKKFVMTLALAIAGSVLLTCCGGGGGSDNGSSVVIDKMIPDGCNSCEMVIAGSSAGVEFEQIVLTGKDNYGNFTIRNIELEEVSRTGDVDFNNIEGSWVFHPNNSSRNEVYFTIDNHDPVSSSSYLNFKLTQLVVDFVARTQVSETEISGVVKQISISFKRPDGSEDTNIMPFPAELRLRYLKK